MEEKIDDILRDKLYDGEPLTDFTGFDRIEDSLLAAEKEEKRRRRGALILLFGRYAAAGVVVIALSFLIYKISGPSGNTPVITEAVVETVGSMEEGTVVPDEFNPATEMMEGLTAGVNVTDEPVDTVDENIFYEKKTEAEDDELEEPKTRFGFFRPVSPGQITLSQFNPTGIITADTVLYDLDEYMAVVSELSEDESDEEVSKWHQVFLVDALAVNKSSESSRFGFENSLRINSYYGNTFKDKGLVNKLDNVLVDKYAEQIGVIMSTYNYDRLTNPFPFSLSLGVGRDIGTRMGIESGLLYSFMKSYSGAIIWTSIYFEQKIQYLGVPVTLYYSLLPENSNWDIDLRGGITAEKALSAIGTTSIYINYIATESSVNKDVPSNIMLSGHAGMGFGYSLFRNFGLYAEPAFEYYFYTKGQPVSYKTDNPFRFNIRAGVRFNF